MGCGFSSTPAMSSSLVMLSRVICLSSVGVASAYLVGTMPAAPAGVRSRAIVAVESWYDAGARLTTGTAQADEVYFCNEQGCWVGSDAPVVVLPDGRKFSGDFGVAPHKSVVASGKRVASQGIFAPLVKGTKRVMGDKELNKLRAQVIAEHTKVITAFVDTSDSPFGQIALRRLFDAADRDKNGTLDREEIRDALHALGFTFIENKQLDKIFERGDLDGNEVIDFEEFVKETPKTLRMSLVKLAKQNGHDLGFLAQGLSKQPGSTGGRLAMEQARCFRA